MDNVRRGAQVEGARPIIQRRGVGRPSKVAQYEAHLVQWLRENPNLPGAEILRRARLAGYLGGKSALYELVRRLRVARPDDPGSEPVANATVTAERSLGECPHRGVTRQ